MNTLLRDLLRRVREKDEGAFQELLKQYRPMIYSFFKNYRLEDGDYSISREDLYQEGCLALLEAAEGYREGKGAHFSTFAYIVIKRRIHHCLRKEYRKLKREHYSLDTLEEPDYYGKLTYGTVADQRAEYQNQETLHRIRDFIGSLDAEDRNIVAYRSQKKSYIEIAEILGINPKRVDNRLQKIKHEFRKKYTDKSARKP